MRILLTGASGQLGHELSRLLSRPGWEVSARTRRQLDIADPQQVDRAFAARRFDLVVNAAGYTDVDGAESDQDNAYRVNAEGPERLARACSSWGAAMIHLSTDYVFDGTNPAAYAESDPPCPANTYGRTKEAGERAVRDALDRHLIIRTAWLFGAHGRNFVKTMMRLALEREELAVVADQYGNPTAAIDLARGITALVRSLARSRNGNFAWGTYHCVNQGMASWHDFAGAIIDEAASSIGRRPAIRPIGTEDYPTPAFRPRNSQLDCTKLQKTFGIVMPPWRRTLPRVIDEIVTQDIQESARSAQ